jgi:hypothetical protein
MSEPVTRGEFEMLASQVSDNARRLEAIDAGGTRGVGALAVQIAEVIKDVAGVQNDLKEHKSQHEHDSELRRRDKMSAARFRVTASIAASAVGVSVIALLVDIAAHVH